MGECFAKEIKYEIGVTKMGQSNSLFHTVYCNIALYLIAKILLVQVCCSYKGSMATSTSLPMKN